LVLTGKKANLAGLAKVGGRREEHPNYRKSGMKDRKSLTTLQKKKR
jgi:hypothetical protein